MELFAKVVAFVVVMLMLAVAAIWALQQTFLPEIPMTWRTVTGTAILIAQANWIMYQPQSKPIVKF